MQETIENSLIDFKKTNGLCDYEEALAFMDKRVSEIDRGRQKELFWFLQHPAIYTAGTSAKDRDLLDPTRFPVYNSGRGGQYTYHGPGQRIIYIMVNLKQRKADIRKFVYDLESILINTLAEFDLEGERKEGRIGIWITKNGQEKKIAAIGIRIRRWITFHGISLNVNPNLEHFSGIVPCGIDGYGVTSLQELNVKCSMDEVDRTLKRNLIKKFDSN